MSVRASACKRGWLAAFITRREGCKAGRFPTVTLEGKGKAVNIYVGNLASDVSEEELKAEFQSYGQVSSVQILKDKMTGQPRGFGFVEMPGKNEAQAAINGLNGKPLRGRDLRVSEARPKSDSRGSGGGRGSRRF